MLWFGQSQSREPGAPRYRPLINRFGAAAVAAGAGLWVSAAEAEVRLFSTNVSQQFFSGVGFVDLNGPAAGGTTLSFSTTAANQRVIISFNAECSVEGDADQFAGVDIVVDPAGSVGPSDAPPTNEDNALCTGNGTTVGGDQDGWVSAAIVASARPAVAGTHTVRVRVTPLFGTVRLDDLSLTVLR